jgi:hypothetical protein
MKTSMGIIDAARYYYHQSDKDKGLAVLLKVIEEQFTPPPDNECFRCGMTDSENEDNGYGGLIDFRVITSEGEEGYANELRFVCQDHFEELSEALIDLGFGSHRHGGINFLEDDKCPGARFIPKDELCPGLCEDEDD